jgi:hypothetical protein
MSKNIELKLNLKPTTSIIYITGSAEKGPIHSLFTQLCYNHMEKYTPFDTGNLAIDSVVLRKDSITYNAPYSHYMYMGQVMGPNIPIKDKNGNIVRWFSKGPKHYTGAQINYDKSKHHLATSYWDKHMWSAEKDDIIKEMEKYLEKHGG